MICVPSNVLSYAEPPEYLGYVVNWGLKNSYRACRAFAFLSIGPNSNRMLILVIFLLNVILAIICLRHTNILWEMLSSVPQDLHFGESISLNR